MDKKLRAVSAFTFSAIITAVFIVALTIAGELYKPLKDLLKEQHHHHWVGKGIWSAILFFAISIGYYGMASAVTEHSTARLVRVLSWMFVLATFVLFGFFTYEFFIHV